MRAKRNILLWAFMLVSLGCFAQAGSTVFNFLALPYSAKHNAYGGENVSLGLDGDMGFALNNPALLSPLTHNNLQLDYAFYGAAMHFAGVSYGH
ncbi:MAG: hypothetical protein HUK20_02605, partial [Fibrobacter sp.]|nr:hypothetical protein [Fibrobacter sp.]